MKTLSELKNWEEAIGQVVNGDCLEFMKLLPDKSIDLVLTDPPYGIGIANNPFRQKYEKSDWDNSTPSKECFDEIFRISKEQVIWGGNYFNLPPSQGFFIWDKVQPQNFSSSMCEFAWSSKQSPAKLFKQRVVSIQKFHPTTKPAELMKWCLTFFPDAQIIFDPFLGSGTTAVAAESLGRRWIGCELLEKYCKIGEERIKILRSQPKMF